jgi:hypothetical protein
MWHTLARREARAGVCDDGSPTQLPCRRAQRVREIERTSTNTSLPSRSTTAFRPARIKSSTSSLSPSSTNSELPSSSSAVKTAARASVE